jgi:hypothetical protein
MPAGGALTELLAGVDEIIDAWVADTARRGSSTPELVAALYMTRRPSNADNWDSIIVAMLATAIRRLAPAELRQP